MSKKTFIEFLVIILLLLLVWLGVKWYKTPGIQSGVKAPEFSSVMPNGDSIRLSELKGYWVLIDFWGSWCGPCREANKTLVSLYKQYHQAKFTNAKGFTILSIGIETKKERWLNAIRQDGLIWPHHGSTLNRFNEPAALLYGIREIPATILVNPNGNILGVNYDYDMINALLTKSLKKN